MKSQTIDEVLEHYGIKGMHWGVRKTASAPSGSPEPVVVKTKRGMIKTSGGAGHPVSEDARKAAEGRRKAKESGPNSLTNAEMRAVVERMNLEQQFSKLNTKQKSTGQDFVKFALQNPEILQKSYGLWKPQSRDERMKSAMELGASVAKAVAKKKK